MEFRLDLARERQEHQTRASDAEEVKQVDRLEVKTECLTPTSPSICQSPKNKALSLHLMTV
jgi:hypothetical protein